MSSSGSDGQVVLPSRRREVVAFVDASVRKRPQTRASVRGASDLRRTCRRDENRRETQNCRHFLRFVSEKCQQSQGSGGRSRETQNCRHFWTRLGSSRLKSVNSHGSGGSWSRNAALSSLLDASRFFVSEECQRSRIGGVLVAKRRTVVTFGRVSFLRVSKVSTITDRGCPGRETQNCRHFWTRLGSSRFKSVNSHRDRGAVVSKRRTVVTFGLVSGLCVSKVSTVTDRGGPGRETQHCRHFWTRLASSCLKSVNGHGSGGSWSRNAELSSLLDASRSFVPQKCQQSQGSGGSWSRNAALSSLLALPLERGEERGERRKER